jgi:hypothetical protein
MVCGLVLGSPCPLFFGLFAICISLVLTLPYLSDDTPGGQKIGMATKYIFLDFVKFFAIMCHL